MVRRSLTLGVSVLLTFTLHAQWNDDPTQNDPICTYSDAQYLPAIVSDGDGGAIVAWVDHRLGSSDKVYAQRIDGDGVIQWTTDGVSVSDIEEHYGDVAMADDGSGGAVMVFRVEAGNGIDVYAQHIDGYGDRLWGANGMAICTADQNQSLPDIIPDGQGGVFMTWMDARALPWDIYAQHLDASGTALWGVDGTPVSTMSGSAWWPRVVADASGGIYVVWNDDRTEADRAYAQRLDAAGDPLWAPNGIELGSAPGRQSALDAVADGEGGLVVCWINYLDNTDIFAQRIDPSGGLLWSSTGLAVCDTTDRQDSPNIIYDGTNGVYIEWTDGRDPTLDDRLFAQHLDLDGTKLWAEQGVAVTAGNNCHHHVEFRGFGSDLISVWMEDSDIRAQRMSPSGETLWGAASAVVCSAPGTADYPCLIADDTGVISAWTDRRNSNQDIYCSKIFPDGRLTIPQNNGTIPPPYEATTRGGQLQIVLGEGSNWAGSLFMHDSLGRVIAMLDTKGTRSATLDDSGWPVGMLFAALRINDGIYGLRLFNTGSALSILR
ncbi:MAG TPA: hypothetical protein PLB89_07620 [Flavobacteriales bacterium]|nr:hypothetical protein [Flavobacteriales bacterium]